MSEGQPPSPKRSKVRVTVTHPPPLQVGGKGGTARPSPFSTIPPAIAAAATTARNSAPPTPPPLVSTSLCIICNNALHVTGGNSRGGTGLYSAFPLNQPGSFFGDNFKLPERDADLHFVLNYLFCRPGVKERLTALDDKKAGKAPLMPLPLSAFQTVMEAEGGGVSEVRARKGGNVSPLIRRVVCGACVGALRNAYLALVNLDERVRKEGLAYRELGGGAGEGRSVGGIRPLLLNVSVVRTPGQGPSTAVIETKFGPKPGPIPGDKAKEAKDREKEKEKKNKVKMVDAGVNTDKPKLQKKKTLGLVTAGKIKALFEGKNKRKMDTFLAGLTSVLRKEMRELSLRVQEGRSSLSPTELTENGYLPEDRKVGEEVEKDFPGIKAVINSLCFTKRNNPGWNRICTTALCALLRGFNGKVNCLQATVALSLQRLGVHISAYPFFSDLGICCSHRNLTRVKGNFSKSQGQGTRESGQGQGSTSSVGESERPETGSVGEKDGLESESAGPATAASSSSIEAAAAKCGNLPRRRLWPIKNKKLTTLVDEINAFGGRTSMEEYVMTVELQRQEKEIKKKSLPPKPASTRKRRQSAASVIVAKSKALLSKQGKVKKVKVKDTQTQTGSKSRRSKEGREEVIKKGLAKMLTSTKKRRKEVMSQATGKRKKTIRAKKTPLSVQDETTDELLSI